jgi:RNA polymerase sigma factor (sigma-70 family)
MGLEGSSDWELIESCLRGEQRAWTQLIAKYERLIYSVARALCTQEQDCADVFQRVCLALYQNLERLRSDQIIPAWLTTVARRQASAVIRDRKLYTPIEENQLVAKTRVTVIAEEFEVELALRKLDERCKRLVRLLYFDPGEPSYSEIAAQMTMPVASIGPTRARCLEKLRKFLSQ